MLLKFSKEIKGSQLNGLWYKIMTR